MSPRNVTLPYGIKTFPNGKREQGVMYVDLYYSTVKSQMTEGTLIIISRPSVFFSLEGVRHGRADNAY